ncbi:MAG: WYL domain-containing protein [Planctomycetia bacterium]|nr:WYL domain-containing protein [Planctomycetia bacterium]
MRLRLFMEECEMTDDKAGVEISEEEKNLSKVARILKIIELLQRDWHTVPDLAKRLSGVSERTVQRDLMDIQEYLHRPLQKSHKLGYRYLSEEAKYFLTLDLTEAEAGAVFLLCQTGRRLGTIPYLESVETAMQKLTCLFPPALRENLQQLERVSVQPNTAVPPANPTYFHQILQAMAKGHAIKLEYDGASDSHEITPVVWPYHLHFTRHAWYVTGRSILHQDVRTFHLERIKSLTPLPDASYVIPLGWSYQKFLGNAWCMIPDKPDYDVHLRFTKLVARNVSCVQWHKTGRFVKNPDGTVEYYVTVAGLREILWWILGYGDQVEVLSPDLLREKMRNVIANMARIYEK